MGQLAGKRDLEFVTEHLCRGTFHGWQVVGALSLKTLFIYFSNHIPFFLFFWGRNRHVPAFDWQDGGSNGPPLPDLSDADAGDTRCLLRGRNRDEGTQQLPEGRGTKEPAHAHSHAVGCYWKRRLLLLLNRKPVDAHQPHVHHSQCGGNCFGQTEQLVDYLPYLGQRLL